MIYNKGSERGKTYENWALTLTLRHKNFTDMLTHVEQYEIAIPILMQILETWSKKIFGSSIISLELTKNYNLHFHMIVNSPHAYTIKIMRYLLDECFHDSIFGFYFVRPIYDIHHWMTYINKDPYFVEKYKYSF